MEHLVPAMVRFLSPSEGGRQRPVVDGGWSQLRLGEFQTSVKIHAANGLDAFAPLVEHEVLIEIIFWEHYGHLLDPAAPVELYEGSHLIGVGRYLT